MRPVQQCKGPNLHQRVYRAIRHISIIMYVSIAKVPQCILLLSRHVHDRISSSGTLSSGDRTQCDGSALIINVLQ
jgi:hypothetical protein